jgi:hypothetical protein
MRIAISKNYKIILSTLYKILLGFAIAYSIANGCEDYYRQLVRFSFRFINGDSIRFIGKNFHLFPSSSFVVAFALFISLVILLLKPN